MQQERKVSHRFKKPNALRKRRWSREGRGDRIRRREKAKYDERAVNEERNGERPKGEKRNYVVQPQEYI